MKGKRFDSRLEVELKELRSKGVQVLHQDKNLLLHVFIVQTKDKPAVKTLLGLFKRKNVNFIKSLSKDTIGCLIKMIGKTYEMTIELKDKWPFNPPIINMRDYHVSLLSNWSVEDRLYTIVKSFKIQYEDLIVLGKPKTFSGIDFFFVKK